MTAVPALFLVVAIVAIPLWLNFVQEQDHDGAAGAAGSFSSLLALPAAALLVAAFAVPAGVAAAALTVPWLVVAGAAALARAIPFVRDPDRLRPSPRLARDFAVAFLLAGTIFLAAERLGVALLGFSGTLVLLAAVHYHVAGFVLVLAGSQAWSRHPTIWLARAVAAVILGIPLTALGFFGLPVVNWAGAMLVACGGLGIAVAHLAAARRAGGWVAPTLGTAGVSLLVAMPLAIAFATALMLGIDGVGIDVMARIHGGLNVIGFAVPATIAWAWESRRSTPALGATRRAEAA